MLVGRLLFFDYPQYFGFRSVPNHDMFQGAPFFTTNMHSIRLSGEIAWWNPVSNTGYAQYYQSFFSPLAPTPGHITTIVWGQIIGLLAAAGVAIPEYVQFLIVTYIIQPYLALFAFALLCSLLFRSRLSIALVMIVYTFSNIGLWNGAWFFFQEPFSLFLLLAALVGLLQRPTIPRLLLVLGSGLIQFASLNYWTLYNLFFFVIFMGTYVWAYPNQLRRLVVRLRAIVAAHKIPVAVTMLAVVLVVGLWAVLIGSIMLEQSGQNIRRIYTIEEARGRVPELRRFTTELFNNSIWRAVTHYSLDVTQHNARYLGSMLIPLLLIVPLLRWGRRERWLVLAAGAVLVVCFAPPFLIALWDALPMLDQIVHLFYFYEQYWEILLALLAGAALDILLTRRISDAERRRLVLAVSGAAVLALAGFGWMALTAERYPRGDPSLEGNLWLALLTLLASGAVLRLLLVRSPRALRLERQLAAAVLIGLTLADLSNYFVTISRLDERFTRRRWVLPLDEPMPESLAAVLQVPWEQPVTSAGFRGDLFRNMPLETYFWPNNTYMVPRVQLPIRERPEVVAAASAGEPVAFYPPEAYVAESAETIDAMSTGTELYATWLMVEGEPGTPLTSSEPAANDTFSYQWGDWTYNHFSFRVNVPAEGWLLIRQLPDTNWQIKVNGQPVEFQRANFISMALPVSAGVYNVEMDYLPLARRLYGIAGIALEAALLGLAVLSQQRSSKAVSRQPSAVSSDKNLLPDT